MSHTILERSKQCLHNKKRRPNKEHQCGADQIPSKGQVRIFSQLQSARAEINYAYLFPEGLWVFIVAQSRIPLLMSQIFSLQGRSPLTYVYSGILLVLQFHPYWDSMDQGKSRGASCFQLGFLGDHVMISLSSTWFFWTIHPMFVHMGSIHYWQSVYLSQSVTINFLPLQVQMGDQRKCAKKKNNKGSK